MDVVVVGWVGLSDLTPVLRALERKFKREINVLTYSPPEFGEKIASGDHFVTSLLKTRKAFLKGGADELENLVGQQAGRAPSHRRARD